mmetsp:Transcript_21765/g.40626  ORF Transcript_21765/g.40626 Transcript_21765/m.40626 type:complete len:301 (+) Transcript_21765:372-1274(+)
MILGHLQHEGHSRCAGDDRPRDDSLGVYQRIELVIEGALGVYGDTDARVNPGNLEHVHVIVYLHHGGTRVDDEIELEGQFLHLFRILQASVKFVGADRQRLVLLPVVAAQYRHVSAEHLGVLDRDGRQSAERRHGHVHPRLDVIANDLEDGTAAADEGTGHLGGDAFRDLDGEPFLESHDLGETAAVGVGVLLAEGTAAGSAVQDLVPLFADVFPPDQALGAALARIPHPRNADRISDLQMVHGASRPSDRPDALVSGAHGKVGQVPIVVAHVHVGTAEPAKLHVDFDVRRLHGREGDVL